MKPHLTKAFVCILLVGATTPAIEADWTRVNNGPTASRFITNSSGRLLGGRVNGVVVEVLASTNNGTTWTLTGTVGQGSTDANSGLTSTYFDPCVLSDGGALVYCAVRVQITNPQGSIVGYQIVMCRSTDSGNSWTYDSTVDVNTIPAASVGNNTTVALNYFLGAPCLFFAADGNVQCYYDSSPAYTAATGNLGGQYIMMKSKGKFAYNSAWNGYSSAASRPTDNSYVRDGVSSVVNLGGSNMMLVCEGLDPGVNNTRLSLWASYSYDNGQTWDHTSRTIIHRSFYQDGTQAYAFCPAAIRFGGGPVGVAFCSDDFEPNANSSKMNFGGIQAHVQFIKTLDTFNNWGGLEIIDAQVDQMYLPSLYEIASNVLISTIDFFNGKQVTDHR